MKGLMAITYVLLYATLPMLQEKSALTKGNKLQAVNPVT
jgi:hypothetical protein